MKTGNGNLWSQTACNRLVAQRADERRQEVHLNSLRASKGLVDHSSPRDQAHLRTKPKTKKLQEDRAAEIQLENRILLQKMLNIDTKPAPFSNETLYGQRFTPRSLNGESQRRELNRITGANQDLLKRLQDAKPSIDPRGWEEEEMDRQALKFRVSQNSTRGRVARLRMPERSCGPQLPRLDGAPDRFSEDEWSRLTNHELDKQLRDLQQAQSATLQDRM